MLVLEDCTICTCLPSIMVSTISTLGISGKEKANAPLQIFQMDQLSNKEFAILEKYNLPIHHFITKKESFYIATRNGKLIVVGSDARGTAYGILEL